jgi:hypothetical protein
MYSILISLLLCLVYFKYGLDFFLFSFEHPFLFFSLYTFLIGGGLLEICINTQGGFIPPKHDPVNFYFVFWSLSCMVLFGFLLPLSIYYTGECISVSLAFDEIVTHMIQAWGCTFMFGGLFLYTKHFTLDLNDIRRMHYEEKTVKTRSGKWEVVSFTQKELEHLSVEFKNSYEIQKVHSQSLKEQPFKEQPFKEQPFKEQSFKEQSFKEQSFKEQSFKEQSFKEQSFKEQSFKKQQREPAFNHGFLSTPSPSLDESNLKTSINTPLAYSHISDADLPQVFTLEVDKMSDLHPEWLDPAHNYAQSAHLHDQDNLQVSPLVDLDDLPPPPYYAASSAIPTYRPPSSYIKPPLSFDVQEALATSTPVIEKSSNHSETHLSFDTIGVPCPLNEEFLNEEDVTPSRSLDIELPDWFDQK